MDEVCGFLGCELLRRVLGAASVPDLSEIADGKARERAELLVVEIGVGVLVDAPESAELLVEFAEGCYDALALDSTDSRSLCSSNLIEKSIVILTQERAMERAIGRAEVSGRHTDPASTAVLFR